VSLIVLVLLFLAFIQLEMIGSWKPPEKSISGDPGCKCLKHQYYMFKKGRVYLQGHIYSNFMTCSFDTHIEPMEKRQTCNVFQCYHIYNTIRLSSGQRASTGGYDYCEGRNKAQL
jgi:hypothetical protein